MENKINLVNIKMSKKVKKEVITETLNNMDYLEIRRLLINLIDSPSANRIAYEYLIDNHESKLIDSLKYNEVIEE